MIKALSVADMRERVREQADTALERVDRLERRDGIHPNLLEMKLGWQQVIADLETAAIPQQALPPTCLLLPEIIIDVPESSQFDLGRGSLWISLEAMYEWLDNTWGSERWRGSRALRQYPMSRTQYRRGLTWRVVDFNQPASQSPEHALDPPYSDLGHLSFDLGPAGGTHLYPEFGENAKTAAGLELLSAFALYGNSLKEWLRQNRQSWWILGLKIIPDLHRSCMWSRSLTSTGTARIKEDGSLFLSAHPSDESYSFAIIPRRLPTE